MNKLSITAAVVTALALIGSGLVSASPVGKRVVVRVGEDRTFTKRELTLGTVVACTFRGRTLTAPTPSGNEAGWGTVWPKPGAAHEGIFNLSVTVASHGTYLVTCGLGGLYWEPLTH